MKNKYQNRKAIIGMLITSLLILLLSSCGKTEYVTPIEQGIPIKSSKELPERPTYVQVKDSLTLTIKN